MLNERLIGQSINSLVEWEYYCLFFNFSFFRLFIHCLFPYIAFVPIFFNFYSLCSHLLCSYCLRISSHIIGLVLLLQTMWSQHALFGINNGLDFSTMLYWVAMNNNSIAIVTRHIVVVNSDDRAV